MNQMLYRIFDSITREELYNTWSFDAMLEYRDNAYIQQGRPTCMHYSNTDWSQKTLSLINNMQINSKLNIGAQYGPRR